MFAAVWAEVFGFMCCFYYRQLFRFSMPCSSAAAQAVKTAMPTKRQPCQPNGLQLYKVHEARRVPVWC